MNRLALTLSVIILFLALFDTFSTIYMIQYGFEIENNFLMRWVLNNFHITGFLFVKLATALFMSITIVSYWNYSKIAQFGAYLVIGVYSPVVFTQLKTILEV